jgi:transcriptional regulator with XRE-family HTH domain
MNDEGQPHERLKEARKQAGYRSAAAFADACDITEATYRSHENGTRSITVPVARQYAPYLGVDWKWLLFGEAEAAINQGPPLEPPKRPRVPQGMAAIDELDAQAGAGPGGILDHETVVEGGNLQDHIAVKHTWTMPSDLVRQVSSSPASAIKILTIIGNSMVPDLLPGAKVMVDTADLKPSPPGIFVVYDGMSFVAKIIEYIPFSDPPKVRIKSKNSDYEPYERTLDEAYIQGRVVGLWQRT